jgi:hypothetical protein
MQKDFQLFFTLGNQINIYIWDALGQTEKRLTSNKYHAYVWCMFSVYLLNMHVIWIYLQD